jgi:hypothetical protein
LFSDYLAAMPLRHDIFISPLILRFLSHRLRRFSYFAIRYYYYHIAIIARCHYAIIFADAITIFAIAATPLRHTAIIFAMLPLFCCAPLMLMMPLCATRCRRAPERQPRAVPPCRSDAGDDESCCRHMPGGAARASAHFADATPLPIFFDVIDYAAFAADIAFITPLPAIDSSFTLDAITLPLLPFRRWLTFS